MCFLLLIKIFKIKILFIYCINYFNKIKIEKLNYVNIIKKLINLIDFKLKAKKICVINKFTLKLKILMKF